MSDNKPLLFINSAQSKKFKDQNQYVYDSRFHKKDKRLTEFIKQEEKVKIVQEEEKIVEEKKPEVNEQVIDNPTISQKLMNKIQLLNKRAILERYVLVSVETQDKVIEGYFMKLDDDKILVKTETDDEEIEIKTLKNITILKV